MISTIIKSILYFIFMKKIKYCCLENLKNLPRCAMTSFYGMHGDFK